MKNILKNRTYIGCYIHCILFVLSAFFITIAITESSFAAPDMPSIKVIYPKDGHVAGAVDSTFIFGQIKDGGRGTDWSLTVNGLAFPVHADGGFLAFVPITPGEFTFNIQAVRTKSDRQSIQKSLFRSPDSMVINYALTVAIPLPRESFTTDSLIIGPDYKPPPGDLVLSAGERLTVSFQATPGCRAWFSLPGLIDSIPMVEMEPRQQPYWGESVFGAGSVPDTLLIQGVYTGFTEIPDRSSYYDNRIIYHLAPPDQGRTMYRMMLMPHEARDSSLLNLLSLPDSVSLVDSSNYTVTANSPEYPFVVRFTDSVLIVRHGPRKGYLGIFQPKGVEAEAVGRVGSWYKLKLSQSTFGWVDTNQVERLQKGIQTPRSYVVSVRTYGFDNHVLIEIPLKGNHPFRLVESSKKNLSLKLFGVNSDTDWIRYDTKDSLIDIINWSQPEDDLYELDIQCSDKIWGFEGYYEGNTFYVRINYAPDNISTLRGKVIVLDPGHSSDPGAIGPTGYTEAEANLGIALSLQTMLEAKGATVVMTRSDTSHVDLYGRPVVAKLADADLFISIHNNALPDGVNPLTNNGTSTFYYQPHSIDLARAIHGELVPATGLADRGLYHGNLAVIRPTQYPAVLLECAFMMIPEQEAMLKSDSFRYEVAKGICKGVEKFLKEHQDN